MNRKSFLILLLLFVLNVHLAAQEKPAGDRYAIKARPLLQQCEELKEGEDAAVAQAAKDLATADAAGKIRLAGELSKSCHKKSSDALVSLLQDKDPLVRIAAIEALAQLGNEEAIEPMIEIINDPDWHVRFALGPALCAFQKHKASYAALNYLVVVSQSGPLTADDVRARGVTALAVNQLRDVNFSRKTLFYLFSLQQHEDEAIRQVVKETLTALKDTRNGAHELVGLLKQTLNPNYRRNCAYWLGQLKIEKGRDILTDVAQNDPDATVKKTAAEALKLLGPGESSADESAAKSSAKTKANATVAQPGRTGKAAPKPLAKTAAKK